VILFRGYLIAYEEEPGEPEEATDKPIHQLSIPGSIKEKDPYTLAGAGCGAKIYSTASPVFGSALVKILESWESTA